MASPWNSWIYMNDQRKPLTPEDTLHRNIFTAVLVVIWIGYAWQCYISSRQRHLLRTVTQMPDELVGILKPEIFERARVNLLQKSNFVYWSKLCFQIEKTLILVYGGIPFLWKVSGDILAKYNIGSKHEVSQSLLFLMIAIVYVNVWKAPFDLYSSFFIEKKQGLKIITLFQYLKSAILNCILTQAFALPIMSCLLHIIKVGGDYFFLFAWLFTLGITTGKMSVIDNVIAPLFEDFTLLPECDLKTRIINMAARIHFPLGKILVVKTPKRSSHSHVYFYGIWRKNIVLYDNLITDYLANEDAKKNDYLNEITGNDSGDKNQTQGFTVEEILAVLAHEFGHWEHRHNIKSKIFGQLNTLFCFLMFSLLFRRQELYSAFGFNQQPTIIGLVVIFQYIFSPYNEIFSFFATALTRSFEFTADMYTQYQNRGEDLARALIKLKKDQLSFPVSDWLFSKCNHPYPPLLERLEALR